MADDNLWFPEWVDDEDNRLRGLSPLIPCDIENWDEDTDLVVRVNRELGRKAHDKVPSYDLSVHRVDLWDITTGQRRERVVELVREMDDKHQVKHFVYSILFEEDNYQGDIREDRPPGFQLDYVFLASSRRSYKLDIPASVVRQYDDAS